MLCPPDSNDTTCDLPLEPFLSKLRNRHKRLYTGSLPAPLGSASTYNFEVCGLRTYDQTCLERWPQKPFIQYQYWWLEVSDELFRKICPADLLDLPCPFRGSQTRLDGCKHLRLCEIEQKWNLCVEECAGILCPHLHGIEPTCRSLQKQIAGSEIHATLQFRTYQTCKFVTDTICCEWGHDFEGARIEAIWNYFNHYYQAQRAGYRHLDEQRDAFGQKMWKPKVPHIETLSDLRISKDETTVTGFTFHGHRVTIPIELYDVYMQRAQSTMAEQEDGWNGWDDICEENDKQAEMPKDDSNSPTSLWEVNSFRDRSASAPMDIVQAFKRPVSVYVDSSRSKSLS